MQLFDDGSHGDETENDGIYTATVADTEKEGTYTFYVSADGPTPAGNSFNRESELQQYLAPRVSAAHLELKAVRRDSDDPKIKSYALTTTPQDALGNYLGPRYAGAIALKAGEGIKLGSLTDNLDGSYTQDLALPEKLELKDVGLTLSVQDADTTFVLADIAEETKGLSQRLLWSIILILVILAFILVALKRRP
jgi:hypothetical protein